MAGRSRRGATRRAHVMPFGAVLVDGGVRLPPVGTGARAASSGCRTAARAPMQAHADGWFSLHVPGAAAGTRYAFRIDGGTTVPDPASRFNPDDVHQPSEVVDPCAFAWHDGDWRGRPWHEAVIYELHVGTFTPQGTFAAAIEPARRSGRRSASPRSRSCRSRIFPGGATGATTACCRSRPTPRYGRPEDFKRLVDAAHARGLMVLLDVVYNHFGPDGNYLHAYAPAFFSDAPPHAVGRGDQLRRRGQPHGARFLHPQRAVLARGVSRRRPAPRRGARDRRRLAEPHIVEELAAAVRAGPGAQRHVHLVLENDHNRRAACCAATADGGRMPRPRSGTTTCTTPRTCCATGERDGYYADYAAAPAALLARALAEGFAFQGEASGYRDGARARRAERDAAAGGLRQLPADARPGRQPRLRRAHGRLRRCARRCARCYACLLLAPAPPMLFMGEEFAAGTPFLYFCDFDGRACRVR